MDKCECLEERSIVLMKYGKIPVYSPNGIQICNGTKEREECSCNGDPIKCNFYPEKRKEGKMMNTAEMFVQANKDGKTYVSEDMRYSKGSGFYNCSGTPWIAGAFRYVNDIFELEWKLKPDNEMTKAEAEAKFNIKIVDD